MDEEVEVEYSQCKYCLRDIRKPTTGNSGTVYNKWGTIFKNSSGDPWWICHVQYYNEELAAERLDKDNPNYQAFPGATQSPEGYHEPEDRLVWLAKKYVREHKAGMAE